jgi:hypothetical protein
MVQQPNKNNNNFKSHESNQTNMNSTIIIAARAVEGLNKKEKQ